MIYKDILLFDTDKKKVIKKYQDSIIPNTGDIISLFSFSKEKIEIIKYNNYVVKGIKHMLRCDTPEEGFLTTKDIGNEYIVIFVMPIEDEVQNIDQKTDTVH